MIDMTINERLNTAIDQVRDACDLLLSIEVVLRVSESWPKEQQHIAIDQIRELMQSSK